MPFLPHKVKDWLILTYVLLFLLPVVYVYDSADRLRKSIKKTFAR